MRWKVSVGLLIFAASVTAFIGLAAGPAHANGGSTSFSFSIGSSQFSRWDAHRGHREHRRPRHRRHHHNRRNKFPGYWPSPWPAPPRVVIVEPRREITPVPSLGIPAYCREFQKKIFIDGHPEHAYGVACRQPDGTWKIQP